MNPKNPTEQSPAGRIAVDWFRRDSSRATVHSTFDSVINLKTRSGNLVSLADTTVPLSPFTLRVSLPPDGYRPPQGEPVRLRNGQIATESGDWSCRVPHPRPSGSLRQSSSKINTPEQLSNVVSTLRRHLTRLQPERGLIGIVSSNSSGEVQFHPETNDGKDYLIKTAELSRNLLKHFTDTNSDALRRDLGGLKGLGPGLTPSGDDALVGLLAAWRSLHEGVRDGFHQRAGDLVVEQVQQSSSWFSNQWLQAASGGLFARPVANLLRSLATNSSSASLDLALDRLNKLGSSSGLDVSTGVLLGLGCVLARENHN
ncbi:MAG: DUF2877 domain-containing protein [bacterium]